LAQQLRDYAIVTIVAEAGVLTPPDPSSLFAWAVPAIWLYQGAISRPADVAATKPNGVRYHDQGKAKLDIAAD